MAFDVKKWLIEDLGFSEAEATELVAKFDGERATKLEKGYLRQSDYSRHMNDLQKAQTDLKAANDRLNAEMAEWASLTATEKEQATKLRGDLEKSQQDVLKLTQVVTRVATEAGLNADELLKGATVVPTREEPKTPPVDLTGYVKEDQLRGLATMSLRLPAILAKIDREHHALTGEYVDQQAIIAELETRAATRGNQKSLDPVAIWEELHEIPAKRDAKAKREYDAAIKAAETRGREAALTEASIPGQAPPPGRHAPVFQTVSGQSRESALKRPQPGTGLHSAVAAMRTGKYRQQAQQQPPAKTT